MKKILLFISMFLFITNVKALTFNVNLTNIEDKGNNGTIGSIESIDVENKTLDVLFQDIGDEVNFDLTISNTGDRAGTLKSITVESTSESIEYTNNLPETGLAINGNDSNTVTITAKVKEGAVNGTSSSEITIKYNYDEGSCPEGETLSEDESMCLCPEGYERNENGICVKPEKETITCKDDEIYNETKKICEKKVTPTPDKKITPSNPKTLDNIVLITLLFFVSGLGIYAVLYKKLQTKKKQIIAGIIVGIITLGASFTVLAGIFGLDNLLSAIVNPITKSKEIVVTVNEEIDLIETWDGNCDLEVADLTPSNIFDGGSGTESDPYQIKTAEQLSCLAKSVNNGTTYEGQYIKQTKNIKLNNKLLDQVADENNDLSSANLWYSAGSTTVDYYSLPSAEEKYFAGTYDGDNYIISGMYITDDSAIQYGCKGLFGYAKDATFRNIKLSDVYTYTSGKTSALLGYGGGNITLDNVTTAGTVNCGSGAGFMSGVMSIYNGNNEGDLTITNTTNNVNVTSGASWGSGIIARTEKANNVILKNTVNNGTITKIIPGTYSSGLIAENRAFNTLIEDSGNNGDIVTVVGGGSYYGAVIAYSTSPQSNVTSTLIVKNSYNTGNISGAQYMAESGGLLGNISATTVTIEGCYNSGEITTYATFDEENPVNIGSGSSYFGGVVGYINGDASIKDCYNTGNINITGAYTAGIVGGYGDEIDHCYNTGDIYCANFCGGILSYGGNVKNSYNTGRIVQYSGPRAGGIIGYEGGIIENSYNTGEIVLYDSRTYVGGLCSTCTTIRNSYNRGNIVIRGGSGQFGGIAYNGDVENSYNSGKIIFENAVNTSGIESSYVYIGGITQSASFAKNTYNLGDIEISQNGESTDGYTYEVAGIGPYASLVDNSVNMGNITYTVNSPYTKKYEIVLLGITRNTAKNNYNGGTITLDDSKLDTPIREQLINNEKHVINISEIALSSYSDPNRNSINNRFANPDGLALACYPTYQFTPCTLEDCQAAGTYTSDPAPSILSIINADSSDEDDAPDNAFEILEGDTLPTLKIFNE